MTIKNYRNAVVLVALESTEGTYKAPTATDGVLFQNLSIAPVSGSGVDRANQDGGMSTYRREPVDVHSVVSFSVENAASGTAGTPPAFGALLKACGLSETITAGTSVLYRPADTDFDSVSMIINIDGHNYQYAGCRGTAVFRNDIDDVPMIDFTFTTRRAAPLAEADLPDVTLSDYIRPLVVNNKNFEFAFGGHKPAMSSLSIDLGNNIAHRDMVGAEDVVQTGRQTGGSVTFDVDEASGNSFITASQDGTDLNFQFGTKAAAGAGNRFQFGPSAVQLTAATLANTNGYLQCSGGLRFGGHVFSLMYS